MRGLRNILGGSQVYKSRTILLLAVLSFSVPLLKGEARGAYQYANGNPRLLLLMEKGVRLPKSLYIVEEIPNSLPLVDLPVPLLEPDDPDFGFLDPEPQGSSGLPDDDYLRHKKIGGAASAPTTPTFVNETSKNSLLTDPVGTNPSGQTACTAWSYCIPLPDAALSGNFGIVVGHFANSTTLTPTSTDNKSDSWSCTTGGSKDSGTNEWPFVCYGANLTAGVNVNTTTFGTTAVTQVTEKFAQFYNVATSSPLDGSIGSCAGTSSSTANCASVSPTQANDLIYVLVCRAGTPAVTSFTAGSGFTLGTEDVHDGCASEWEVDSGTGSITPSMTMASASTYVEIVAAFKAASAGTAPNGWYMEKLMSWSSPATTSGTESFQFTSSGNFLAFLPSCGSTLVPGAITDSVNTWTLIPGNTENNVAYTGQESYVGGAVSNPTGALSVASAGTGDCTYTFESYKGAPSSVFVGRGQNGAPNSAAATLSWSCNVMDGTCPPASSPPTSATYIPAPTNGLLLVVGSVDSNTFTGINNPASGCNNDMASTGGEAISGPWPVDENNPLAHCYISSGSIGQIVTYVSSSTLATSYWAGDLLGVWGASGSMGILNWITAQPTSGTSLALTVPATLGGTNDLVVLTISIYNGLTITHACFDGTTCAAGNALAALSGATSTGSGHAATTILYLANPNSGQTTLTITVSGTISNLDVSYQEVTKASGGTWATDGGVQTTNGTGSGATVQATAITTTGTVDFCTAVVAVSGSGITAAPKAANEYVYASGIWAADSNAFAGLITTSAASHQPQWTNGTSGGSYSSSHGCFK